MVDGRPSKHCRKCGRDRTQHIIDGEPSQCCTSECGQEKTLDQFGVDRSKSNGLRSRCKSCECKQTRRRYEANPEKRREKSRRYRAANPEKQREQSRRYRAANPEKVRESERRYAEANREKVREKDRRWRAANLEKLREQSRRRYAANPEKLREQARRWRAANPEKVRESEQARRSPVALEGRRRYREANREKLREQARRYGAAHREERREYERRRREANREELRERDRRRRAELRAQVFAHYGTSCACCGSTERLQIDHINGDGKAHRIEVFGRSTVGGCAFYAWLIAQGFPGGYQALCLRCNISKGRGARCILDHSAVAR